MKTIEAPVANFEQVFRPDLWHGQGRSFYSIKPVKGARIEGTIAVGMSSQTVKDWPERYQSTVVPAMWVDLTPQLSGPDGRPSSEALTFTVNGKVYEDGYNTRARVEFIPCAEDDHRDAYYRRVTVNGVDYFLSGSVNSYDAFSDSARTLISAVIQAIAAEYVTSERWHAKRVEMAEAVVEAAQKKYAEAQTELWEAGAALRAVQRETRLWIVTDSSGAEHVIDDAGDEQSAIELAHNLQGIDAVSARLAHSV